MHVKTFIYECECLKACIALANRGNCHRDNVSSDSFAKTMPSAQKSIRHIHYRLKNSCSFVNRQTAQADVLLTKHSTGCLSMFVKISIAFSFHCSAEARRSCSSTFFS